MKSSSSKFWMVFAVLLLVAGGTAYFMRGGGEDDAAKGPPAGGGLPVVGFTVTPATLDAQLQAVGTLEAGESASLRAEVAGTVAAIHFTEGAPVKLGQLLIEIDARTYQEEYNKAQAAYELARLTEGRRRKLLKSEFISEQAVDEAKGSLRETMAAMEAAKLRLEKTKIAAPFDGIVGLRSLSVGDFLSVGDMITDVVAIDPMKVQIAVPERYFSRLSDTLPVTLNVDAWQGRSFEGELYAINPNVDAATRNVTVKAIIRNKEQALRPGMFARVHLSLGKNENALLIPEEAIIPQGEKASVMKVVEGKVEPAEVALGLRRGGKVEVLSGVSAGDVVITAGHMKVGPGMQVTVLPADTAPAAGDSAEAADDAQKESENE